VNELWQRLRLGGSELLAILPAVLGAIAILVAGYFLARLVERWTDSLLVRLNFNKVAERGGLSEAMDRTGTRLDPIHAVGKLLFWMVMLVVILLASSALGLESINLMFGTMLSYIPTLIAAIVIVILGMIVGEFVRAVVLASAGRVEGVPVLAKIAKASVVTIAIFMAVQQLGVHPRLEERRDALAAQVGVRRVVHDQEAHVVKPVDEHVVEDTAVIGAHQGVVGVALAELVHFVGDHPA